MVRTEASGAGVDPAAVALALGGASRERADAFLKDQQTLIAKQGALVDDQRHHLREQFKRLKMGVISDRLSIALKALTGLVGIGVAVAVAIMVWNAAHADGLVVESFSVPPDLASRWSSWRDPVHQRSSRKRLSICMRSFDRLSPRASPHRLRPGYRRISR